MSQKTKCVKYIVEIEGDYHPAPVEFKESETSLLVDYVQDQINKFGKVVKVTQETVTHNLHNNGYSKCQRTPKIKQWRVYNGLYNTVSFADFCGFVGYKEHNMSKVVEFYLINTGPCTPGSGSSKKQIYSFEDLINYTNSYSSSIPYTIELKCVVKTYDEEKFVGLKEEVVDTYKLYVGDKLVYADDIARFVNEQYSLKDFQKSFIKERYKLNLDLCVDDKGEPVKKDKPVVLDKIQLSYRNAPKKAGIQDPKEEDLELTRVPLVQWHYLTPKEIFVDRKTLRRIAEDGTVGKVLIDLKEFFTKKR